MTTFGRAMALAVVTVGSVAATPVRTIAALDLSAPFATRSPWRLTATQGPNIAGIGGDSEAGEINLCLSDDDGKSCDPAVATMLAMATPDDFAVPHFVNAVRIVHPFGARGAPLLLIAAASQQSGDGDQRHGTLVLAYDRATDRFRSAYRLRVGQNNNQEIRYLDRGPLAGAIVSAEPTQDAPFGYWLTVSKPGRDLTYRQMLRYRSATRYNDGNALKVIDSEMPAIERRLGLWRPGQPLPLPAGGCARPRLTGGELWCGPKS